MYSIVFIKFFLHYVNMSGKHHKHSAKHSTREDDEYEVIRHEDYGYEDLPDLPFDRRRPQVACGAQAQDSFCVPLSFDQELVTNGAGLLVPLSTVAQNNDNIRGVLKLKFNSSLSKAAYALYVFNATNEDNRIISAHLHLGPASANGPVVVTLFEGPARNVNGLLIKGTIDNRDVVDFAAGGGNPATNSVASLYQAIRDGRLYVNVHSEQFPDGVVRGQIYLKNAYRSDQ